MNKKHWPHGFAQYGPSTWQPQSRKQQVGLQQGLVLVYKLKYYCSWRYIIWLSAWFRNIFCAFFSPTVKTLQNPNFRQEMLNILSALKFAGSYLAFYEWKVSFSLISPMIFSYWDSIGLIQVTEISPASRWSLRKSRIQLVSSLSF